MPNDRTLCLVGEAMDRKHVPSASDAAEVDAGMADPELAALYAGHEDAIRAQNARIGCVLALVCMPLGSLLDYFVYPHMLGTIFYARIGSDALLLPIYLLLARRLSRFWLRVLSLAWAAVCMIAISWMIAATEGASSPYYAGLNLVVIVTCLLVPVSFREAVAFCLTVIACYIAACAAHGGMPSNSATLFNNAYFLTITALICVTSSYYGRRRRMAEFLLRQKIAGQNRDLAAANDRLFSLDRMKSEFFAAVTHELRTPLTLIISPLDLLLEEDSTLSPKARRAVGMAKENGLRLLKLINDLLEISRIEHAAGRALAVQPVRLPNFLRGLADTMREIARRKKLTLSYEEGAGADGLVVDADPGALEKIVLNLLTNAIKFTEHGGIVTLCLQRVDSCAQFEVRDTGIGIPAEMQDRIFERFQQADGSETRKHQGVGLGLALVRDLVALHKGTLSLLSQKGRGSSFFVQLPLSRPGDSSPGAASPPEEGEPIREAFRQADRHLVIPDAADAEFRELGSGHRSVLVIDDEPQMREFLTGALAARFRVFQSHDGEAGLRKALAEKPDAVVLDWMLPSKTGLDVCKELRESELGDHVVIIMLTARTGDDVRVQGLRAGADDFLVKPFSVAELEIRLSRLLLAADNRKALTRFENGSAALSPGATPQ